MILNVEKLIKNFNGENDNDLHLQFTDNFIFKLSEYQST